ncbi:unnamed protein product, partial [Trypanosoma congolense IL3000]
MGASYFLCSSLEEMDNLKFFCYAYFLLALFPYLSKPPPRSGVPTRGREESFHFFHGQLFIVNLESFILTSYFFPIEEQSFVERNGLLRCEVGMEDGGQSSLYTLHPYHYTKEKEEKSKQITFDLGNFPFYDVHCGWISRKNFFLAKQRGCRE